MSFMREEDMKILITGDWHLTDKVPERRTDDYTAALERKMDFIFDVCEKYNCSIILQPGDVFDHHSCSYQCINTWIEKLKSNMDRHNRFIYAVFGQHDLRYHSSNKLNTPLKVMDAAEAVTILETENFKRAGVHLYGCNWNEELPKPERKQGVHILVVHRMIIKNKKLWEGQEEFDVSLDILKQTKFDYIVSGDNHSGFTCKVGNRVLFNCGSLMRSNINQKEHRPSVWVLDTHNRKIKQIFIPVEPYKKVFDFENYERVKGRNEELMLFIEQLETGEKIKGLEFQKNLTAYLKNKKISKNIKQAIDEVMQ